MARKRFLVVEDSFIGMTLIKGDERKIVEIETDVALGGMTPGSNLVEVDENGNPVGVEQVQSGARKRRTAAADPAPADGGDLA